MSNSLPFIRRTFEIVRQLLERYDSIHQYHMYSLSLSSSSKVFSADEIFRLRFLAMEASNFVSPSFRPGRINCPTCSNIVGVLPQLASCLVKKSTITLGGKFPVATKHVSDCVGLSSKSVMLALTHASCPSLLKPCHVKSEDSEETLSGESIILNEQTLERELQIAIEEENYAKAAKLRDSLLFLQEDSKASVLAANARFYNAFRNGNLAAMQALWSKCDNVCVVHPGVSGISGYDLVMGSWEFVWADYEFPLEIEIKDVQVHIRGDVGYVTCIEMVKTKGSSWGKQFATNVFEKIDRQWHICIHHASYIDL